MLTSTLAEWRSPTGLEPESLALFARAHRVGVSHLLHPRIPHRRTGACARVLRAQHRAYHTFVFQSSTARARRGVARRARAFVPLSRSEVPRFEIDSDACDARRRVV